MIIACFVCGSIDVLCDDTGLFVCQDCGARYTLEAMQKMVGNDTTRQPPKSVDERIESYFSVHDYDAAYELFSKMDEKEIAKPKTRFYGDMSRVIIDMNEGRSDDATKDLYGIISRYLGLMRNQTGVLNRDKLDGTLSCLEILIQLAREVHEEMICSINEKYEGAYKVDPALYDADMSLSESFISNLDINIRMAIDYAAELVDGGYTMSAIQLKRLQDAFNSIRFYNKYPLAIRQMERLSNSTEKSHRSWLDTDKVDTLRKKARQAWMNKDYDVASRIYKRIITIKKSDIEADCLIMMHTIALIYSAMNNLAPTINWEATRMTSRIDTSTYFKGHGGDVPEYLTNDQIIDMIGFAENAFRLMIKELVSYAKKSIGKIDDTDSLRALRKSLLAQINDMDRTYGECIYQLSDGYAFVLDHKKNMSESERQCLVKHCLEMIQSCPEEKRDKYWNSKYQRMLRK